MEKTGTLMGMEILIGKIAERGAVKITTLVNAEFIIRQPRGKVVK